MSNQMIVVIALFLVYFHISGLATTNILRLTASNTLPVLASECRCGHCGEAIPAHLQLPIISYIICKGKCKSCGTDIPIFPLFLELTVLLGMCGITLLLRCTWLAVSASYLYYEIVRIVTIVLNGKREAQFGKQYVIAVLSMMPFYVLTLFVAFIYSVL